jgi:hypothetical protein
VKYFTSNAKYKRDGTREDARLILGAGVAACSGDLMDASRCLTLTQS